MELNPSEILSEAISIARQSKCQRALCGSIIIKDNKIIGRGFNSPAGGESNRCDDKYTIPEGNKHDITCCSHAEVRAIHNALMNSPTQLEGSKLYFIRLNDKLEPTSAGTPYCTICSKEALDSGVAEFGLWRENYFHMYNTQEYNNLSYQYFKDKSLWNLK